MRGWMPGHSISEQRAPNVLFATWVSVGDGLSRRAPLNGAIEIVGQDKAVPLLLTIDSHLEAGRFYTLVVLGNARSSPKLEAFLIEDAPTP